MKKNLFRKITLTAAFLCALVSLASCMTDHRAEAVEKARKHALKQMKDLTEVQRDFIRYTDPVIMEATVFTSTPPYIPKLYTVRSRMDKRSRTSTENDFVHTCIVWNPPDMGGKSVVVDGSGERSMRLWVPGRTVIKTFEPAGENQSVSIRKAVSFVANRLPDIAVEDMNIVRFTLPEIRLTAFDLSDTLPGKEDPAAEENREKEKDRNLWNQFLRKAEEPRKKTVQISFSWVSPKTHERIIVAGEAPQETLEKWSPKKVFFRSENEYQSFVKGPVRGTMD